MEFYGYFESSEKGADFHKHRLLNLKREVK